jgi:hypothetical protein
MTTPTDTAAAAASADTGKPAALDSMMATRDRIPPDHATDAHGPARCQ